jgi:DNA-binding response OmpR family regulator
MLLSLAGHRVCVAEDGPSGVREILAEPCDIALVDIGLPGFDGHEVARRVRAVADASVMLVALTGYGTDQDRRSAKDAGFDEFLVKPFDPQRFAGVVALALASRQTRASNGSTSTSSPAATSP